MGKKKFWRELEGEMVKRLGVLERQLALFLKSVNSAVQSG